MEGDPLQQLSTWRGYDHLQNPTLDAPPCQHPKQIDSPIDQIIRLADPQTGIV